MQKVILEQFRGPGMRSMALTSPYPQLKTNMGFVKRYWRLQ
jgi:hypothetical protein